MGLFESAKQLLKRWKKEEKSGAFHSNFTPRAQQVLGLARKESDRFNHNYIGTEHVLLGLIKLGQGVAVNVLERSGVSLEKVRAEVERHTGGGVPEQKLIGQPPYTPRVKKVLDLARREAKNLNHTYIGTEHLLLGLLREGGGLAAQVLRNCDVNLEQMRIAILKELNPDLVPEGFFPSVEPNKPSTKIQDWSGRNFGEDFTPRAIEALAYAREEAQQLHHNVLNTEHILLGLIKLDRGNSANVFKNLGLNLEKARAEIVKLVGVGDAKTTDGYTPYTPRTLRLFERAKEEAKALHHTFIGTDHLLLGLLKEKEGPAAEIFNTFNVDSEQMRTTILKELDPNFGKQT